MARFVPFSRVFAPVVLAAGLAVAGEAPQPKAPETLQVKRELFEQVLTLKGVVVAERTHEVAFRPKAWAQLVVDWAAPHGSRVKAGEVVLSLEVDKLDEAIADAEKAQTLSDLDFAVKKVEYETLKTSVPLDVEAAERALRVARENFERYQKIDRPLQVKSTEFEVKAARDHLTYVKEELRQLEKMYKADELTEETEEIILQRQRNAVERTEFALEKVLVAAEKTMKVDIPRQDVAAKEGVARHELAHAKARAALATALKKAELEFQKLEEGRKRAAEKLAEMKADREALVVKAPFDGIVYYGACTDGNWTGLNRSLKAGTALKPLDVAMTLVQPRPAFVQATVPEKDLMHCQPGLSGTATPVAFPSTALPVKVASVSAVPASPGNHDVKLAAELPKAVDAVVPGMNCTVSLVAFRIQDAIVLPAAALHGDGKPFVYVRKEAGVSEKRPVTIGRRTGDKVQVTDGLKAGDTVFLQKPKDAI